MAPELAHAVLERELGRRTESTFAGSTGSHLLRPRSVRSTPLGCTTAADVAVKIQYPGVAGRDRSRPEERRAAGHLSRCAARPVHQESELRPSRRGARDRRSRRRGARLPTRGRQSGRVCRHLPRAPLHPRPRGDRRAVHRSRADPGAREGQVLERGSYLRGRSCATNGRRRSTASSMPPTCASAWFTPIRTPATTCFTTTEA